jgi:pimeloyl-ACP methyl ester carboxylesterase
MTERLKTENGHSLAYVRHAGQGPGIVWLGGLRSDMEGTKALALDAWARQQGRAFVRFDYFAHGQSSGDWRQASIGRWRADALAVIDQLTSGPQILVGSSMGAWSALLVALARPERVAGLVLIAPAPDFTERLMWAGFSPEIRNVIMEKGEWVEPSEYGEPLIITCQLIEEARNWLLLDAPLRFDGPVRILQGMADVDVPYTHALALAETLTSPDVQIHLSRTGDHRLSTPPDIARLTATLEQLGADIKKAP